MKKKQKKLINANVITRHSAIVIPCEEQMQISSFIIRRRYGDKIIKRLRKFEKIDYRLRKAELDLEFLVKCRDINVIPKFLNFRLANRSLRFSLTYVHCQSNLLLE